MKNRLFIIICLSGIMLSGCTVFKNNTAEGFGEKARKLNIDGKCITVFSTEDWIDDVQKELAGEFEAETGLQVKFEILPYDQYQGELIKRLENGSCPDIFLCQSGFAIDNVYNVSENAVDLTSEEWIGCLDDFTSESTSVDGHVYGITYWDTTTDYYMVYNKKLFKSAGIEEVPTTFNDFLDACEKLDKIGVTPIYEPMADGWHQTMLWAENGQVFEFLEPGLTENLNNNETTFAENENFNKALEQILIIANRKYYGKNYATDSFSMAESYLASGDYAMCMLKPGTINSIVSSSFNNDYRAEDFGIMLFPLCDNQYLNVHPTGASMFVYSGGENIEGAKLFLEYLCSKNAVQYMIDNSNKVENLPFELGQESSYNVSTEEFLAKFEDENSGLVLQDSVKYFNEQWGQISQNILLMCQRKMTPEEVLIAIDEERARLAIEAGDENWSN